MSRRSVVLTALGAFVVIAGASLLLSRLVSGPGAIQRSQFDTAKLGETRLQIQAELGPPLKDPGYVGDYGAAPTGSACDYYNEADFLSPVAFRFCYVDGRLVAKTVSGSH